MKRSRKISLTLLSCFLLASTWGCGGDSGDNNSWNVNENSKTNNTTTNNKTNSKTNNQTNNMAMNNMSEDAMSCDLDTDGDGLVNCKEGEAGTDYQKADTDGDGITDNAEILQGTDPTKADTDDDGINDKDEIAQRTDPNKADTDGDGVNDGDELTDKTDPLNPDSDNDGLNDKEEKDAGTNPNSKDTDGDQLTDKDELDKGTDPTKADTDGDGYTDSEELFTKMTDPTKADTDGDGLNDKEEFDKGTDPTKADTDGDGLDDKDELDRGTDPLNEDSDGDTIKDGDEVTNGTDPLKKDSDGDGLNDNEEIDKGTDPTKADGDGDGLNDKEELALRTDPNKADTDGDGLNDKEEGEKGTNPLIADIDMDGLNDGDEIMAGSDPKVPDTDGDGINDGDEVMNGTDPTKADTDGDGLDDKHEQEIGTDATKADTDGDGVDDFDEITFGLDPNMMSSLGDGVPDGERFIVNHCNMDQSSMVTSHTNPNNFTLAVDPAWGAIADLTAMGPTMNTGYTVLDESIQGVSAVVYSRALPANPNLEQELLNPQNVLVNLIPNTNMNNRVFGTEFTMRPGVQARTVTFELALGTPHDIIDLRNKFVDRVDLNQLSGHPQPPMMATTFSTVYVTVTALQDAQKVHILTAFTGANTPEANLLVQKFTDGTGLLDATAAPQVGCHPAAINPAGRKIDFYWVLDQSGSMTQSNNNVRQAATQFFQDLSNAYVDFRMGVTNMSANYAGKLRPMVGWHNDAMTFSTEILDYVIDCTINDPMCAGANEHGLYNAQKGIEYMLDPTTPANQRIRPDAELVTIVITDEDAQSLKDQKLPNGPPSTRMALTNDFKTFFNMHTTFLTVTSGQPCGFEEPLGYREMATHTGGADTTLCTQTLSDDLKSLIFTNLGLGDALRLPERPISSTIRVFVSGMDGKTGVPIPEDETNGFVYNIETNTISLNGNARPGPQSFLSVHYQAAPPAP